MHLHTHHHRLHTIHTLRTLHTTTHTAHTTHTTHTTQTTTHITPNTHNTHRRHNTNNTHTTQTTQTPHAAQTHTHTIHTTHWQHVIVHRPMATPLRRRYNTGCALFGRTHVSCDIAQVVGRFGRRPHRGAAFAFPRAAGRVQSEPTHAGDAATEPALLKHTLSPQLH